MSSQSGFLAENVRGQSSLLDGAGRARGQEVAQDVDIGRPNLPTKTRGGKLISPCPIQLWV